MNVTEAHAWCASLPGATLDYKWKFEDSVHPVFSVGGRMFAMFTMRGGKLVDALLFKTDDHRFLELTDRDGITPSPYLARAKWVTLDTVKRLADAELKSLLSEAHSVILAKSSKKAQAAILATAGAASDTPAPANTATKRAAKASSKTTTKTAAKSGSKAATKPETKATTKTAANTPTKTATKTARRGTTPGSTSAPKPSPRRASR